MAETQKLYLKDLEGNVTVFLPRNWLQPATFRPQASKKVEKPLDLSEPQRCYHTHDHSEELSEGFVITKVRCENPAVQDGKHGWLCSTHFGNVLGNVNQLRLDIERQIIADILLTERTALKGCKREIVRLSPSQSITYLVR